MKTKRLYNTVHVTVNQNYAKGEILFRETGKPTLKAAYNKKAEPWERKTAHRCAVALMITALDEMLARCTEPGQAAKLDVVQFGQWVYLKFDITVPNCTGDSDLIKVVNLAHMMRKFCRKPRK